MANPWRETFLLQNQWFYREHRPKIQLCHWNMPTAFDAVKRQISQFNDF
jgi:hypothetical protein